jgi:hypothetical protein
LIKGLCNFMLLSSLFQINVEYNCCIASLQSMAHLVEISSAELTFSQVQVQKVIMENPGAAFFSGLGAATLHFQL